MKKLHAKAFSSVGWDKLVDFVNINNIQKEDIVNIITDGTYCTLFYYA